MRRAVRRLGPVERALVLDEELGVKIGKVVRAARALERAYREAQRARAKLSAQTRVTRTDFLAAFAKPKSLEARS